MDKLGLQCSGAGHELGNQRGKCWRLVALPCVSRAGYDLDPHGRQAHGRPGEVLGSDEGTVTAAREHDGHAELRDVVLPRAVAALGRPDLRVITPGPGSVRQLASVVLDAAAHGRGGPSGGGLDRVPASCQARASASAGSVVTGASCRRGSPGLSVVAVPW